MRLNAGFSPPVIRPDDAPRQPSPLVTPGARIPAKTGPLDEAVLRRWAA